jgi:penicillin V acylase-like amidase (Ntn superfamily)
MKRIKLAPAKACACIMALLTTFGAAVPLATTADACTGITLKAQDGAVLFGRTMEWGAFDLNGRITVIPRGHEFTGQTPDGPETMYEMFRILDNFNVPLGATEGTEHKDDVSKMRSSTIWTSVYDTRNKVVYYHTQHNRRVRKVTVGRIDFDTLEGAVRVRPLDRIKAEDFEEVNPLVQQ